MENLSKTIFTVLAVGLLSCAVFSQQAQAIPITGGITFGGTVSLNDPSAGTASAVLAGGWHGAGGVGSPLVMSRDGSFNAFVSAGAPATFTALQWDFASGPVAAFWVVGGFTFSLIESHVFAQGGSPAGVIVNGTGTIVGNGFEPTFGTWSFSTQDPAAGTPPLFSFSAATGATGTVPDGGSMVTLLGLALGGLEGVRRLIRARKA